MSQPAPLDLQSVPFLAGLAPRLATELTAFSEPRRYEDGARVFQQGERIPGVFVVASGALKVFRSDGRGHVQVLDFIRPGQCVGEVQVFDSGPIASSAEAHGATACWLIPAAPLRELAHRTPEVAEVLIQHFAGKVRHLVELVDALSLHSVPERVAQIILDAQERHPERLVVEFEETQEDLAQCIGASREAFSRALRLLTDLDLIHSTFPVVRIVEVAKLQRYAKG
ncbi:MAG TPA: Crp/Fnr family transcriptional regulator [Holophagaceae bacterium]|jgi:CRP-like cAMP-binding protein|nr:Crp/Fnr family transcriptional regulator [Holophagaceae bacterium]